MERFFASKLVGKPVLTKDGLELGEVVDLEIERGAFRVVWVFVALHRDVTHHFHMDAPFVMGTKAIALQPQTIRSVGAQVLLEISLSEAVAQAVVSFPTDETRHLGTAR